MGSTAQSLVFVQRNTLSWRFDYMTISLVFLSLFFFHLAICLCMCILFVHICFSTQLEIRGQHVRIYTRVPGIGLRLSALASVFTHWAISAALHWCLVAGNKTITSFAPASEWAGVSAVNELNLIFRTVNTEFICFSLQSSG